MSVNKVILLGNVGKDPDVRYPSQGQTVASFPFATSDRAYTNSQGVQVPERTEWHNIVMWGKNAEVVEKYVRKGAKLYIEGKLRTRNWIDNNTSNKRYITEVYVDNFEILSTGGQSAQNQQQQPAQQVQPQQPVQQPTQNEEPPF